MKHVEDKPEDYAYRRESALWTVLLQFLCHEVTYRRRSGLQDAVYEPRAWLRG